MSDPMWHVLESDTPLAAAAIHNGHDVRREVAEVLALTESDRLREEDPYTGEWTSVASTRIVALRSRFEVDLNRPRERAVYLEPQDAWGLQIWKQRPSQELVERSLAEYDAFYREVHRICCDMQRRFGRFVVLDLHSYNHLRPGPDDPPADPQANPEVNVGTASLDRARWAPVVDRFIRDLRSYDFLGRGLDVRENIKFQGGHFPRWIHANFSRSGCALAVEFKKFFMNEWTGKCDQRQSSAIIRALGSTVPGLLEELGGLDEGNRGAEAAKATRE